MTALLKVNNEKSYTTALEYFQESIGLKMNKTLPSHLDVYLDILQDFTNIDYIIARISINFKNSNKKEMIEYYDYFFTEICQELVTLIYHKTNNSSLVCKLTISNDYVILINNTKKILTRNDFLELIS